VDPLFFGVPPCNSTRVVRPQDSPQTVDDCPADSHGTENAHAKGCRCPGARRDHYLNDMRRKLDRLAGNPRIVDATGTHRRLRALMALGWRARDLAPRIGWHSGELDTIFRRMTVHRDTAAAIRDVYRELSDKQGPSEQTRRRAARNGWLMPIWWDDETIDDPAWTPPTIDRSDGVDEVKVARRLAGDRTVRLNQAEKAAAVQQLTAARIPPSVISVRLGVNSRYVRRYAAGVA
jgi:hypothetical protein